MIKVLAHGNIFNVENPVTGEVSEMINVVFGEAGRAGADKTMSETSAFLSALTVEDVGLVQTRTHTHPVKSDKSGLFPIDKEFPCHINRGLFSVPQMRQQLDKEARIIDGKPTYFKTWISERPEEDKDARMDVNVGAQRTPITIGSSNVGAATVNPLRRSEATANSNTDQPGATYTPASVLTGAIQSGQQ